jgi:hypothetical protein
MSIKETIREEVSHFDVEFEDGFYEVIVRHEYDAHTNELNSENIEAWIDSEEITHSRLHRGAWLMFYCVECSVIAYNPRQRLHSNRGHIIVNIGNNVYNVEKRKLLDSLADEDHEIHLKTLTAQQLLVFKSNFPERGLYALGEITDVLL